MFFSLGFFSYACAHTHIHINIHTYTYRHLGTHTRVYVHLCIKIYIFFKFVFYFLPQLLTLNCGYRGRVLLKLYFEGSLRMTFPYEHFEFSSQVKRVNRTPGLVQKSQSTLSQSTVAAMPLTPDGCSISAGWSNVSDECLQLMRLILLLAVW